MDVFLAYDVSSDVLVDIGQNGDVGQAGATFYGPSVDHLTISPTWMSTDGLSVTVICPGNCYNGVWGRAGGDSLAIKAKRAADRQEAKRAAERQARIRVGTS